MKEKENIESHRCIKKKDEFYHVLPHIFKPRIFFFCFFPFFFFYWRKYWNVPPSPPTHSLKITLPLCRLRVIGRGRCILPSQRVIVEVGMKLHDKTTTTKSAPPHHSRFQVSSLAFFRFNQNGERLTAILITGYYIA